MKITGHSTGRLEGFPLITVVIMINYSEGQRYNCAERGALMMTSACNLAPLMCLCISPACPPPPPSPTPTPSRLSVCRIPAFISSPARCWRLAPIFPRISFSGAKSVSPSFHPIPRRLSQSLPIQTFSTNRTKPSALPTSPFGHSLVFLVRSVPLPGASPLSRRLSA